MSLQLSERVCRFGVRAIDAAHWLTCKALLASAQFLMHRPPRNVQTLVVLRNCFFGDFVVALPALQQLRAAFPDASIVFLVAGSFAPGWRLQQPDMDMFDLYPGLIDRVVRYSAADIYSRNGRAAIRRELACTTRPWAAVALCYSSESMRSRVKRIVLCRMLGLPFPLGLVATPTLPWQHRLNRWRRDRVDIPHQYESALRSAESALEALRVSAPRWTLAALSEPPSGRRRRIGIAPFTKQFVKQWPLENFAAVMRALSERFDADFEVYGAAHERESADALLAHDRQLRADLTCGELSAADLTQRISRLDLLICLDSAPAHVASLVGTPVVAVFSQITLPQFWRPWGPAGSMVSIDVPCATCDTRTGQCPLSTKACIDGISPGAVIEAAERILRVQPA